MRCRLTTTFELFCGPQQRGGPAAASAGALLAVQPATLHGQVYGVCEMNPVCQANLNFVRAVFGASSNTLIGHHTVPGSLHSSLASKYGIYVARNPWYLALIPCSSSRHADIRV